jgi:hypothetical protein
MLFNVIMNEIIKEVKGAGKRLQNGNREVKIVYYADDAIIISEDGDNLQRFLHKFGLAMERCPYLLKKARSLVIARIARRCKLAVYNKSVEASSWPSNILKLTLQWKPERRSANDQNSRDAARYNMSARYNMQKQIHELKEKDKDM